MQNFSSPSSSRSIKRKRFDDEIVGYSLGIQPTQMNKFNRSRTQSQSTSLSEVSSPVQTVPTAIVVAPVPPPALQLGSVSTIAPMAPIVNPNIAAIDKRTQRVLKTGRKNKRKSGSNQIATKDLGRWKPIDDLALIIGIQQTNDLKTVFRGTKFSCKFTMQELQSRWYSLLYEEPISRIAVSAMRNLHPEMVESVQSKALYSVQEEELLGTIKSTESPGIETFQDLLDKNASVFYPARTAKALSNHWVLMKQYSLLPDQTITSLQKSEHIVNFSDAEDMINDTELTSESRDEALEIELALSDRKSKKEIRMLENELTRWNVLVDSLTGIGFTPEFDNQTLAVLRGRLVRYLMRSREIIVGRSTKDYTVDVNLELEGPAAKVSRKQGTIKLRSNGDFFITNEGKRPLFIDGMPLLTGNKIKLNNNCVIEISGLRFIFLINYDLINAIRQESAKLNNPLN